MEIKKRNHIHPMKLWISTIFFFIFVINAPLSILAKEKVLIIRNPGVGFEQVVQVLKGELAEYLNIEEMVLDETTKENEILKQIDQSNPKIFILMDNRPIALFKKYQSQLTKVKKYAPSVALMGVLIEEAIKDVNNATGISYEIPIVTSVVNLRSIIESPIDRVGVLYRKYLENFIITNSQYCEKEKITLVDYLVTDDKDKLKGNLKKGLKFLYKKKKINALWIPNDNALLQPILLKEVWLPFLKENKIPVIVGVEALVNPKLDFGSFAVLPDHMSLGSQAAEIVYEIMENDWINTRKKVEAPLSVYEILNILQMDTYFSYSQERLKYVDKLAK